MSPENFTELKNKIASSPIFTEAEKKEWLFLLPKMTSEQLKELERLLSIRMPAAASPAPGGAMEEPRVSDKQLATSDLEKTPPQSPIANRPSPAPQAQPSKAPPAPKTESSLAQIQALGISELRKAPSIYVFLEELAQNMKTLAAAGKIRPAQLIAVFEQSPLYKTYLEEGLKILDGQEPQLLTKDELETIADFRGSLRELKN